MKIKKKLYQNDSEAQQYLDCRDKEERLVQILEILGRN